MFLAAVTHIVDYSLYMYISGNVCCQALANGWSNKTKKKHLKLIKLIMSNKKHIF